MALTGKHTFQVRPQDCDFAERIAIPVLGNYILQTAGFNADENGFGMAELRRLGHTWVLSRLAIEMKRLPCSEDIFTIETWIESIGRVATTRNFKILDGNNAVIGGACSNWAMIDFATRQSLDLRTLNSFTDYIEGSLSIIEKPVKIIVPEGKSTETRRVRYSDIDFNNHANSMKYLEWILDRFSLEWYREHQIKRLDINFLHEALYDDEVTIFQQKQNDVSLFEIKKTSEDISICKIKLTHGQ